jgi:hypothetical protein
VIGEAVSSPPEALLQTAVGTEHDTVLITRSPGVNPLIGAADVKRTDAQTTIAAVASPSRKRYRSRGISPLVGESDGY